MENVTAVYKLITLRWPLLVQDRRKDKEQ